VSGVAHWLEGGQPERIDQTPVELGSLGETITTIVAHPSSDLVLFGTASGNVHLFDPSLARVSKTLKAHTRDVTQIVFTRAGDRFLTSSVDGFVQWWSATTFAREQGFSAGSPIFSVAPSPKGRYLAAGGHDKVIRIWDLGSGDLAHTLGGHDEAVTALNWLGESNLISGGANGTVRAWEVDVRRCYRASRVHDDHIASILVTSDGESYVTTSWDGRIRVWTPKHRLRFELPAGPAAVTSVAFLPGERRLIAGYWNGTIVLWDMEKGTVFEEFVAHEENLAGATAISDGTLVVTASHDGQVRSWSLATMGVSRFANLHTGEVYGLAYVPDNTQSISVGHDGQVKLWDRTERVETASLELQTGPIMSVAVSPDKRLWALGLGTGEIRIWNAFDQQIESVLPGHKDAVSCLAFLPNSTQLLSGSWDMKIKLWSLERHQEIGTLHGHSKEIASLDITLDGRTAASACWDLTARLWDLASMRRGYLSEARCLSGHAGRVLATAFSPDGHFVATASADETVRIWPVEKATEPNVLHAHRDAVTDCRFTPDGQLLLTVGRDGLLVLWNTRTGAIEGQLRHEAPILSVTISPDGTQAMMGDEVGRVRFLQLDYPQELSFVAARTHLKEAPMWLRGARPSEHFDITCLYCGMTESIKESQLGRTWRCRSCGDSMQICPLPIRATVAQVID
jgi:WD40 repeat protein